MVFPGAAQAEESNDCARSYNLPQIVLSCKYLHQNQYCTKTVTHRDLKLGKFFLNEDLEMKIGDLATKVEYDGECKKTLGRTPSCVAPEVLSNKGHGLEVDLWSIGCIMYTLLVGKPPFETSRRKETYLWIKKNDYSIPKHINPVTTSLIQDPTARPTIQELLSDDFFTSGSIPAPAPHHLSHHCTPVFHHSQQPGPQQLKPLTVLNKAQRTPCPSGPGKERSQ